MLFGIFSTALALINKDDRLAEKLSNYLSFNRTIVWNADFEKKIAALAWTSQCDGKKYITLAKITIFKAGDFAGAKAKIKT